MSSESARPSALIVEDDKMLSEIFTQALDEAGYDVSAVLDSQEAFALLAQMTPELIILDLHLPTLSGEEVLRQIRTEPRFEKTPVVIATANLRWGRSLQDRVSFVLVKPVDFIQLRQLAIRLLPK